MSNTKVRQKLLVICGPTATGKTELALKLARKMNGEIVSADSRQVYKGMDVGTGKDLPKNSVIKVGKISSYYKIEKVKVWGYDLVHPKDEFSVAHYVAIVTDIIKNIWKRGKLPILVGGTGFYIKGVVDGIGTIDIPQDTSLRTKLNQMSSNELYKKLYDKNYDKALALNESDRKNPVRLIRAIEIEEWKVKHKDMNSKTKLDSDVFFVGLTVQKKLLHKRIERRVHARMKNGSLDEVKKLLIDGTTWDMKAMNTIGYKEWKEYLEREKSKEEVLQDWIQHEEQYAKRQLTWFKKEKRIHWFESTDTNAIDEIAKKLAMWHTKIE